MLNQIIIQGRLTAAPDLRRTPNDVAVCSFTVAVDRDHKPNDDGEKQADFINCVAWRQTAEFISRYFRKGSSLCITGSIQTRNWLDQQGQKRYTTEVVVDEAMFVDSRSENQQRTAAAPAAGGQYAPEAYATPGAVENFDVIKKQGGITLLDTTQHNPIEEFFEIDVIINRLTIIIYFIDITSTYNKIFIYTWITPVWFPIPIIVFSNIH